MSRRHRFNKRKHFPDPKYNNIKVGKFINILMSKGKKSLAKSIIYKSFNLIQKITHKEPLNVFDKAIDNVRPLIEVKSRRIGGANYQVPVEININRSIILSFRWIKNSAKNRNEKQMYVKLAKEIISASNEEGESIKKKEQTHKMAEANKAFAHYLW